MAATTTEPTASSSDEHREIAAAQPLGPWQARTPREVVAAYRAGRTEQGWAAWCAYLDRRAWTPLAKLLPSRQLPLLWALPQADLSQALEVLKLVAKFEQPAKGRTKRGRTKSKGTGRAAQAVPQAASRFLELEPTATGDADFALECLVWAGALPKLATVLGEQLWCGLLNRLATIAADDGWQGRDLLTAQWLHAELPLTLTYTFGEQKWCQPLVEVARRTLGETFEEVLDGEGLIQARHLAELRPLVACWTRSRAIGRAVGKSTWPEEAARQFPRVVESALRLTRRGGQQVLDAADAPAWDPDGLRAMLKLADDPTVTYVARRLERGGSAPRPASKKRGTKKKAEVKLPESSIESEWAGIAGLRADWSGDAPQLTVAYRGTSAALELSVGARRLLSGEWPLEVSFNGRPLAIVGEWEQICWEADADVDYLELEIKLADEVTVQRHMVLPRRERFALVADAVLGIQPGQIAYRSTLPIAERCAFQGMKETRDGWLAIGGRPCARVLPLALNEWRRGFPSGSLENTAHGLQLTQSAEGQALFAPWFIDLDARRCRREATWRQLTVAEKRQIVPADVAVGYRAQAGSDQWLVYRSLGAPAIRTVLGRELMHEFFVGKFQADGDAKTLLEIE